MIPFRPNPPVMVIAGRRCVGTNARGFAYDEEIDEAVPLPSPDEAAEVFGVRLAALLRDPTFQLRPPKASIPPRWDQT